MIHTGKCPKCEMSMPHVSIQHISANQLGGRSWHAVSYQCPNCHTVVSVEIDPIALKADIVNEVVEALKGK